MVDPSRTHKGAASLLITGADGVLGGNLAVSLAQQFQVLALYADDPVTLRHCRSLRQPADPDGPAELVRRERPQWIIHCGRFSDASWDVSDHPVQVAKSEAVAARLAETARGVNSRFTVLVSDAVFTGPRMFRDEQSPPGGPSALAQAATAVERAVTGTGALVVRTHAYGWSPIGARAGFAERLWRCLTEEVPCRFAPHRYATPILASDLADLLTLAWLRRLEGVLHIAGAERTSTYRFAGELAWAFGLRSLPVPTETRPASVQPGDDFDETSLNTRQARRELGRSMPTLREGLERFARQATSGYRAGLRCGGSGDPRRSQEGLLPLPLPLTVPEPHTTADRLSCR